VTNSRAVPARRTRRSERLHRFDTARRELLTLFLIDAGVQSTLRGERLLRIRDELATGPAAAPLLAGALAGIAVTETHGCSQDCGRAHRYLRCSSQIATDLPASVRPVSQQACVYSFSKHASNPSCVPLNGHYMDHGSDS
jgi:hypothetical protein